MGTLPKPLQAEKNAVERLEKQLEDLRLQDPGDDLVAAVEHRQKLQQAEAIVSERRDALAAKVSLHHAEIERQQRDKQRHEYLVKMRQAVDHLNVVSAKYVAALDAIQEIADEAGFILPGVARIPAAVTIRESGMSGQFRIQGLPQQPLPERYQATAGDWAIDQ